MVLVLLMTAVFLMVGCGAAEKEVDEDKGKLRIGTNNWAENIAVANMWKIILEEKGYEIELVDVGKAVLYKGITTGDLDIGLEVWLPTTDKHYVEQNKDGLDIQNTWYEGTGLGLVVPSYVDIESITELRENKDMFEGQIFGVDSGTSINDLTYKAIDDYDLDYKFIESSETAMIVSLDEAYKKEKPIVVTLWNPHWVFAKYDLKYLEDPQNIYGDGDDIVFITRKGFDKDHAEVLEWLNNWFMTDEALGGLMAIIEDLDSPVEGANEWIKENQDLVNEWIN